MEDATKLTKQLMSPAETQTILKTSTAKLFPLARQIAGPGAFTEAEMENILMSFVLAGTNSDKQKAIKRQGMKDAIRGMGRGSYSTLEALGVVPSGEILNIGKAQ